MQNCTHITACKRQKDSCCWPGDLYKLFGFRVKKTIHYGRREKTSFWRTFPERGGWILCPQTLGINWCILTRPSNSETTNKGPKNQCCESGSGSTTYLSRIRIRSVLGHPDPDSDPYFENRMRESGSEKNWSDPQHCQKHLLFHFHGIREGGGRGFQTVCK